MATHYPRSIAPAVGASPLQRELAEVLRRQRAPRRQTAKTWRVRDAARERYALLGTFERVVDEQIERGVADGEVLQLVRVLDRHVHAKLRARAAQDERRTLEPALGDGCAAEQQANHDCDVAQMRALEH